MQISFSLTSKEKEKEKEVHSRYSKICRAKVTGKINLPSRVKVSVSGLCYMLKVDFYILLVKVFSLLFSLYVYLSLVLLVTKSLLEHKYCVYWPITGIRRSQRRQVLKGVYDASHCIRLSPRPPPPPRIQVKKKVFIL